MHCPNCGKKISGDQKYCRSCGMDLSAVPQLVAQHLSTMTPGQTRRKKDQAALRRMGKTLFAGLAMLIVGMGLLGFDKHGIFGGIGLIVVLLGTLTAAYSVTAPLWQAGIAGKAKPPVTNELPPPPELLLEQRDHIPVPSITEHTTELLKIDKGPRKRVTG